MIQGSCFVYQTLCCQSEAMLLPVHRLPYLCPEDLLHKILQEDHHVYDWMMQISGAGYRVLPISRACLGICAVYGMRQRVRPICHCLRLSQFLTRSREHCALTQFLFVALARHPRSSRRRSGDLARGSNTKVEAKMFKKNVSTSQKRQASGKDLKQLKRDIQVDFCAEMLVTSNTFMHECLINDSNMSF